MGALNSLGRFAAPALAPVALNLGMIGAVFLLAKTVSPPILALALGVLVGGVLQAAMQIPYLAREKGLLGLSLNFRHPAIRRIVWLMAPAALGAAAYQFSVFINTLLASFLPQGSVSYLYYADRIMQFPLGVFAIAIGTAVLPSMSRQAAAGDNQGLKETLSFSLRLIFFITLPAMIGMIVLSRPLIVLLFQHGQFDPDAAAATAAALIGYAVGLWALSAVQVLVRAFYSAQDTKTPVKIALVSLSFNVALSLLLMGPLKHAGLALASSGGSILNFFLLAWVLRRRLGGIDGRRVFLSAVKNTAWAAVMGLVVYLISGRMGSQAGPSVGLAIRVLGGVVLGTVLYLGLARLRGSEELSVIWGQIKGRLARNA